MTVRLFLSLSYHLIRKLNLTLESLSCLNGEGFLYLEIYAAAAVIYKLYKDSSSFYFEYVLTNLFFRSFNILEILIMKIYNFFKSTNCKPPFLR